MALYVQYRPKTWDEVAGQPEAVALLKRLKDRNAIGGQAFSLVAKSGRGKTTIARLIASEVADEWAVTEYPDPSVLTAEELKRVSREMQFRPMCRGYAFILNEAHSVRKDQVPKLLGLLEDLPKWAVWVLTASVKQRQMMFSHIVNDRSDDASALLSRCMEVPMQSDGVELAFAIRARTVAQAAGMDGKPLEEYVKLVKRCECNLRTVIQEIENGAML